MKKLTNKFTNSLPAVLLIAFFAGAVENQPVQIIADGSGFGIKGSNGYELLINGFGQSVGYFGINDDVYSYTNQFLLRRARLDLGAKLGTHVEARVHGEFASSPLLLDAYLQVNVIEPVSVRFGQFKSPVSAERLQPVSALLLNDYAYSAALAPDRDIGILLSGTLLNGILNYQAGVFNGAQDGASSAGDLDDAKEFAGRLGVLPFANYRQSILNSLSVGVGGSVGNQKDDALAEINTPGRTRVFGYNEESVADGRTYRVAPSVQWFTEKFSVIGEYILSSHEVHNSTEAASGNLRNHAWTAGAGYALLGGYRTAGGFQSDKPLNISNKSFGGIELVARVQGFVADEKTFPLFSSLTNYAKSFISVEGGVNWYINSNARIIIAYSNTSFKDGAPSGSFGVTDRETEHLFSVTTNLSF